MSKILNHPAAGRMRRKYPTPAALDQHIDEVVTEMAGMNLELPGAMRAYNRLDLKRQVAASLLAEHRNPTLPGVNP